MPLQVQDMDYLLSMQINSTQTVTLAKGNKLVWGELIQTEAVSLILFIFLEAQPLNTWHCLPALLSACLPACPSSQLYKGDIRCTSSMAYAVLVCIKPNTLIQKCGTEIAIVLTVFY